MQRDEITTIYCQDSQGVREAAAEHGYIEPEFRVGLVHYAEPREDEELVAQVQAERHSWPIPIFRKIRKERQRSEVSDSAQ